MRDRPRVIVTGLVGLYPIGGVAWDYLQYAIGLWKLGCDVYYHEDTWSWPYHPKENTYTSEGRYSAEYIGDFFRRYAPELSERWHYLHLHEISHGMSRVAFDEVARTAELFINVSGASFIPEGLSPSCVKVFLDTDPGYNQIVFAERFSWSENVERWCEGVLAHDLFFTYGENIHGPDCTIPRVGLEWRTTRMPVVLELWEPLSRRPVPKEAPWTTVMTWNAFKGQLVHKGVEYKSKGCEFDRLLMDLPHLTAVPLEVAVGGVNAPLARLSERGWRVVDGPSVSLEPERYREFVGRSRGEISPAKHVYAATRSGWFSCRSACYLAAGRPVVVEETGFHRILPAGEGIVPFSTKEEAVAALEEVEGNYSRHAKAALSIARENFESGKVLGKFLDDAAGR